MSSNVFICWILFVNFIAVLCTTNLRITIGRKILRTLFMKRWRRSWYHHTSSLKIYESSFGVDNIKLMIFTNSLCTLLFVYSFQYRPYIRTAFVMSDAVNEPEPVLLVVSLALFFFSLFLYRGRPLQNNAFVSKLLRIVYAC